jgi:hypothetical protein
VSERRTFEGFSIVLPPGWQEQLGDATYSDPDEVPAASFGAPGGGTLQVSPVLLEEDEDTTSGIDDPRALAIEWGRHRGLATPLGAASGAVAGGTIGTATYRLGSDFVQIWFLSNGHDLVQVTYVTSWASQEVERATREAAVASLRFA